MPTPRLLLIANLTRAAQKTFIVATLASTLVGTFTASMGLWERVSDKRQQHRQKQRDTKQDGEIKELKKQFEEAQKRADGRQQEIDRLKNGGGRDDVGNNFERDGMMVQRMYDQGYGRMGSRFAQGDGKWIALENWYKTDPAHSHCREQTTSAHHLPPTNRYKRPPRCPIQRPPIDSRRHVQTHRRLKPSQGRLHDRSTRSATTIRRLASRRTTPTPPCIASALPRPFAARA